MERENVTSVTLLHGLLQGWSPRPAQCSLRKGEEFLGLQWGSREQGRGGAEGRAIF